MARKWDNKKNTAIASVLFFILAFSFFIKPINPISDLWWHLKTGYWIIGHGGLPSEDPFSFTSAASESSRVNLILKGYWLSQVIFSHVHSMFGFNGLQMLGALTFVLIAFMLYLRMISNGINPFATMLAITIISLALRPFEDIRPEIFSVLFALCAFNLNEGALRRLRRGGSIGTFAGIGLPVLMLVWANIHQGFIAGIAMLLIYLVAEIARHALDRQALKAYSLLIFISITASLINPNHINALLSGIEAIGNPHTKSIIEYYNPLQYARASGSYSALYWISAILASSAISMALSWRRLEPAHIVLYTCSALAFISSYRYGAFFIVLSSAVASDYAPSLFDRLKSKYINAISYIFAVALLLSNITLDFRSPENKVYLPVKAVDYMERYKPAGPVYTPYIWGGYMIWRLHPDYKTFIDSRMLSYGVFDDYMRMMNGNASLLDDYGVNAVLMYNENPLTGKASELLLTLLNHDGWQIAYFDSTSVIFIRAGANPGLPIIGKSLYFDMLMGENGMR